MAFYDSGFQYGYDQIYAGPSILDYTNKNKETTNEHDILDNIFNVETQYAHSPAPSKWDISSHIKSSYRPAPVHTYEECKCKHCSTNNRLKLVIDDIKKTNDMLLIFVIFIAVYIILNLVIRSNQHAPIQTPTLDRIL